MKREYSLDILKFLATTFIIFHHYQQLTDTFFENGINFLYKKLGISVTTGYTVTFLFAIQMHAIITQYNICVPLFTSQIANMFIIAYHSCIYFLPINKDNVKTMLITTLLIYIMGIISYYFVDRILSRMIRKKFHSKSVS